VNGYEKVVWTYKAFSVFPDWWRLRHVAVKITTCDGTVFYADDGWWGGVNGKFSDENIPDTVYEGM
jgi:hypothetical protein